MAVQLPQGEGRWLRLDFDYDTRRRRVDSLTAKLRGLRRCFRLATDQGLTLPSLRNILIDEWIRCYRH